MRGKGIGGHTKPNNGQSVSWLTPPEILERLGAFDLDPCPCVPQPFPTAKRILDGDGLSIEWPKSERVWLNPPYGAELGLWLGKLAKHGDGIAICFARTETRAFFGTVWGKASALLFLNGRIHFHHPDGSRAKGNAGGPSVLIAYGTRNAMALRYSGLAGAWVGSHAVQATLAPALFAI